MYIFEISTKRRIFLCPIRPIQRKKVFISKKGQWTFLRAEKGQKWKKRSKFRKTVFYKQILDFQCPSKILCQNHWSVFRTPDKHRVIPLSISLFVSALNELPRKRICARARKYMTMIFSQSLFPVLDCRKNILKSKSQSPITLTAPNWSQKLVFSPNNPNYSQLLPNLTNSSQPLLISSQLLPTLPNSYQFLPTPSELFPSSSQLLPTPSNSSQILTTLPSS
jgi:hypothetical protein